MSIEVKDLLKEYGPQKAVNHISFKVDKGEIVGFLGPNGAGKSTTMKILTGYLQQTGGEVYVCGINVNESPLETKKLIGYLPELNALYYDMYVKEYLGFVAEVFQLKNKKAAIDRVIETVGLTIESKKKIGQLSKGYKQRVGLAAALIHDPEVLILDEPTTGLDPNQIIEIRDVIRRQGSSKTVLFSSHILQEVEAVCDRVIIINKGELVADDKLADLRKSNAGSHVVIAEFDKEVNEEWLSQLREVTSFSRLKDRTYKFETSDAAFVRKQLQELAGQHHLDIVALQSGAQSLEDVFRNLTSK
ncbi:MAG: gliding motility-associated ABC transporter ATP-binding subunit GldA [Chitinophagaceae bacterium]